jgi:hypothetical protein
MALSPRANYTDSNLTGLLIICIYRIFGDMNYQMALEP